MIQNIRKKETLMKFFTQSLRALSLVLLITVGAGCSVNQVTGERQLSMPFSEQVKIGNEQYGPAQQQQGGRYIVDPDLNVYINQVGKSVAQYSGVNLPYEFVVLNNGVPNAWALPGGKIAINRGLLVMLDDEAQLAAVLGHEVVHAAAEHSANQMRRSQMMSLGVLVAGVAAAAATENDNAALIGAGAAIGAQAWQAHYGRSQELEADYYGIDYLVKAGYDPQASVELQRKFVELSKGQQRNIFSSLFASHPPSEERVKKNAEKAAKLPSGKRNRETFQRAIAVLKRDQPAYALHDQALEAANEKAFDKALSLTEKAIAKQPAEALFYITKGQLLSAKDNHNSAYQAFSKATQLNPEYFLAALGLGIEAYHKGNYSQAKAELDRSFKLLPTSTAVYHLGVVEEKQGNRSQAIQYYKKAAGEDSDIGRAAQKKLQELNAAS